MRAEALTAEWHVPNTIHPLLHDGGVVYFDGRSGEWKTRTRTAGAALLQASGLMDTVGKKLDWPEIDAQRGRTVSRQAITALMGMGLLAPGDGPSASFTIAEPLEGAELLEAGNIPVTRLPAERRSLPPELERVTDECIAEAINLANGSFLDLADRVRIAKRNTQRAPAAQVRDFSLMVYQLETNFGAKVACLERNVAIALAGSRLGLGIDIQFGAAVDPIAFHTWPEADGEPVRLEGEEPIIGRYYPLFKI